VSDERLDAILQAGLLAPTSQNKRPCELYVVRDKEVLTRLSKAKKVGASMLSGCDVAIAVLADSKKADVWVEDCAIAMSYMSLMATDQGVGSCWCQMRLRSTLLGKDAEDNVRGALQVTNKDLRLVGVLALGIPEKAPQPHTEQDVDWDKVHRI
jgi:nitroreductase